jgi:hypothetical protein
MTEPFLDLVCRTRSIRRFHQDRTVDIATLRDLVDLARLSASGGNRQPLKYILLVIALGRPRETVVIEALPPGGDTRYWRDPTGVHHVPKRSLAEITVAAYAP